MKTKVWAHRGASGYAPENTLEAFEMSVKQQADGVELDVQLTKDGELVVLHDETLDRTTDGKGFVKDYTLKEVQALKAVKTHPEYQTGRIPMLAEVYDLLKPTGLEINVELKTGIFFYPGIEEKVLKLTKEMGMEERIWYSSFNHYSLKKVKEWMDRAIELCQRAGRGRHASVFCKYPVSGIPGKLQETGAENPCLDGE